MLYIFDYFEFEPRRKRRDDRDLVWYKYQDGINIHWYIDCINGSVIHQRTDLLNKKLIKVDIDHRVRLLVI